MSSRDNFKKYQHVEKITNVEVLGLLDGRCYVFPKLDGTNGSLWWSSKKGLLAGSRNRELSLDSDNAGFLRESLKDTRYPKFFEKHPDLRLYGEWLVPHSLKTYRDDAWRKFYIFDVIRFSEDTESTPEYLTYDEYQPLLEEFNLDYLAPLVVVNNPTEERLYKYLETNDYLIKDNEGKGEGIVIKNYDFVNRYGRVCWGKIVTSEFKEKVTKEMGYREVDEKQPIEFIIVDEYVTSALVEKTFAKIELANDGWTSSCIPRLLDTVFHDLIQEEMWDILKKKKNPIIDFKRLKRFTMERIKKVKPEVF